VAPIPAAGPLRVSRSLTAALLAGGLNADLYELEVPRSLVSRFTAAEERNMTVTGLPSIRMISPRRSPVLAARGYSLVHFLGTLGLYTVPLLWYLRKREVPTIATLHGLYCVEKTFGYPYSKLDVWGERIALRLVTHVVAVSEPFRHLVERTYPQVGGRISAVEHGFDEISQQDHEEKSKTTDILSMVGTRGVKGVPFLLSAVERLLQRGEPVKVVIAGPVGDDHRSVMRTIERMHPHVAYVGEQQPSEVDRRYSEASIYVQPSHYEPFGIAVLEAMANGLAVVATRQCGTSALIVDGESGFVVEHGDVDTLADRLARLLRDRSLRESMGRAAKAAALPWTWARAAERYMQLYRRLAPTGTATRP
jgi:glycosyltransferase involved in cell wall biosynthesis